ncbi:unnamed protein product, partial [Staurois parvus]
MFTGVGLGTSLTAIFETFTPSKCVTAPERLIAVLTIDFMCLAVNGHSDHMH